MSDSSGIIIPGSLIILLIGLFASLGYMFIDKEKANENLVLKYLRRLMIAIMALSFGFLTILTIFVLIAIMTKITMALFGY